MKQVEAALLGGMICYPESIPEVAAILIPSDFSTAQGEKFFSVLMEMATAGEKIDGIIAKRKLPEAEVMDVLNAGMEIGSGLSLSVYADFVADDSRRNRVNTKLREIMLNDKEKPLAELAGKFEALALECVSKKTKNDLRPARSYLEESYRALQKRQEGIVTGIKTGITNIDVQTMGFRGGDLIVLGGRPRMGKTALAGQIGAYNALHEDKTVAFFEEEMTGRAVMDRMLVSEAGTSATDFRRGHLPDQDRPVLLEMTKVLANSKLFIDESTGVTPLSMLAKCRRLRAQHGLDLVIVDNIQRMHGDQNHKGDKRKEISEVTEALKNIAKDLNVPVIAISHLNRSCDTREDKRPMLSDLHESGNIEQDADLVLFLYRESVYKDVSKEEEALTELAIAKFRDGEEAIMKLHFASRSVRFSAWSNRNESDAFMSGAKHGLPNGDL